MLSDIYLGRQIVAPRKVDVHAHATFSCAVAKLIARLRGLLRF